MKFMNLQRSFGDSNMTMQVQVNYEFLQRMISYQGDRKINQGAFADMTTEQVLHMLENKSIASSKQATDK